MTRIMHPVRDFTRREAIGLCAGFCVAAVALPGRSLAAFAAAGNPALLEEIRCFAGEIESILEQRVVLDLPESAENGHTVPLGLSVESPMTVDDYVSEVLLLAEANPKPRIAVFEFTPECGRCALQTRVRLAESQRVIALARMRDGSVFGASRAVKVTIGGCPG